MDQVYFILCLLISTYPLSVLSVNLELTLDEKDTKIVREEVRDAAGTEKPVVHLAGRVEDQPDDKNDIIRLWSADLVSGVEYSNGEIQIQHTGIYYVYSQISRRVTLRKDDWWNAPDFKTTYVYWSKHLEHSLVKRPTSGATDEILSRSVHTLNPSSNPVGFSSEHSSYIGAVFMLHEGDILYIQVDDLTSVCGIPWYNSFGLFMIKSME